MNQAIYNQTVEFLNNTDLGFDLEDQFSATAIKPKSIAPWSVNGKWVGGQHKAALLKRQGGEAVLTKNKKSEYFAHITKQPVCVYCGHRCTESNPAELDHVYPVKSAGDRWAATQYGLKAGQIINGKQQFEDIKLPNKGTRQNVVISCKACNLKKGGQGAHFMIRQSRNPTALIHRLASLIAQGPTRPQRPVLAPNGYWVI